MHFRRWVNINTFIPRLSMVASVSLYTVVRLVALRC